MLCPLLLRRPTHNLVANVPINVNDGLRKLADDFTRAFQQTQWGVNGRVQPRFFDDSFVFRTSMLEIGKKKHNLQSSPCLKIGMDQNMTSR